jgi:hypothetical protein
MADQSGQVLHPRLGVFSFKIIFFGGGKTTHLIGFPQSSSKLGTPKKYQV